MNNGFKQTVVDRAIGGPLAAAIGPATAVDGGAIG
jgi:hypothetical protein